MRIDAAVVLTAKKLFISIYRGSRTRMLCRIDPRKRITDRKRQKIELTNSANRQNFLTKHAISWQVGIFIFCMTPYHKPSASTRKTNDQLFSKWKLFWAWQQANQIWQVTNWFVRRQSFRQIFLWVSVPHKMPINSQLNRWPLKSKVSYHITPFYLYQVRQI